MQKNAHPHATVVAELCAVGIHVTVASSPARLVQGLLKAKGFRWQVDRRTLKAGARRILKRYLADGVLDVGDRAVQPRQRINHHALAPAVATTRTKRKPRSRRACANCGAACGAGFKLCTRCSACEGPAELQAAQLDARATAYLRAADK